MIRRALGEQLIVDGRSILPLASAVCFCPFASPLALPCPLSPNTAPISVGRALTSACINGLRNWARDERDARRGR